METTFKSWLRSALEFRGWTVEHLARRLDVSRAAVYAWHAGDYLPAGTRVTSILDVLDARAFECAACWAAYHRSQRAQLASRGDS